MGLLMVTVVAMVLTKVRGLLFQTTPRTTVKTTTVTPPPDLINCLHPTPYLKDNKTDARRRSIAIQARVSVYVWECEPMFWCMCDVGRALYSHLVGFPQKRSGRDHVPEGWRRRRW